MDKQYLHEKLAGLRNKYVESANAEKNAGFLDEAKMNKKMLQKKKKLVNLEMERCQKMIEHRDLSKIDQKISAQKELFKECCQQR